MCGRLQCTGGNWRVIYYGSDLWYFSSEWSYGIALCDSTTYDVGLDVQDPGLVPHGASCGTGKVDISISVLSHVGLSIYIFMTFSCYLKCISTAVLVITVLHYCQGATTTSSLNIECQYAVYNSWATNCNICKLFLYCRCVYHRNA